MTSEDAMIFLEGQLPPGSDEPPKSLYSLAPLFKGLAEGMTLDQVAATEGADPDLYRRYFLSFSLLLDEMRKDFED